MNPRPPNPQHQEPSEQEILDAIAAQHGKDSRGYETPFAFGSYPDERQRWKCEQCGTVFSVMWRKNDEERFHKNEEVLKRHPEWGDGDALLNKLRRDCLAVTSMEDTMLDNAWALGKWLQQMEQELEKLSA